MTCLRVYLRPCDVGMIEAFGERSVDVKNAQSRTKDYNYTPMILDAFVEVLPRELNVVFYLLKLIRAL